MTAYILRRLAFMVPVLFVITLFTFFIIRLVPGDPVTAMLGPRGTPERRAELAKVMKLDRPLWEQYVAFLGGVAQGDLGDSLWKKQPVTRVLADRLPPTLFLVFYSMAMTIVLTLPLAAWAALNKGRWPDRVVRVFTVISLAMPVYWIGLMLLQTFAVKQKVFPVSGWGEGFAGHLHALFLPALALTWPSPRSPRAAYATRFWRRWGRTTCAPRGPRGSAKVASFPATCCATRLCRPSPSSASTWRS